MPERDENSESKPNLLAMDASAGMSEPSAIERMVDALIHDVIGPEDLFELRWSHCRQFRRFGGMDDIEKAIEYGTRALEFIPNNHPDRLPRLVDLGIFYNDRFKRLGKSDDLEKTIELQTHALVLTAN
ncbi:hypothetical protein FRC11_013522, partial [Ceratobasidium sp. 423]